MNISLTSLVWHLHCVLLNRKNWYLHTLLTLFWRKYFPQLVHTDGGSKYHRNVATDLSDYRVSYNEIPKFKSSQASNVKSSVTTTLRGNFCANYFYGILRGKKIPGQILSLFTSVSFLFLLHSFANVAWYLFDILRIRPQVSVLTFRHDFSQLRQENKRIASFYEFSTIKFNEIT
jgi:hypothetical protein